MKTADYRSQSSQAWLGRQLNDPYVKAAKAQGITIFTVRVMEGNSTLLEQCASRSDYYYNLSNASELSGALGSIVKSIKKIRLTK
ncbi:MAG: hypothetical protein B7Z26_10395 [Asticcacaulis sp. 32-58-5]|nr:MAG: hypothetical protein B7Z26_10395 [Asticcacaulis sp. 32-58-5]